MTEVERLREALLPCPFCGETPVYDNKADRMVCGRCGAVGPAAMAYLSPKRRWNRRAALATAPPGAERGDPDEADAERIAAALKAAGCNEDYDVRMSYANAMLAAAPPSPSAGEK